MGFRFEKRSFFYFVQSEPGQGSINEAWRARRLRNSKLVSNVKHAQGASERSEKLVGHLGNLCGMQAASSITEARRPDHPRWPGFTAERSDAYPLSAPDKGNW